MNIKFPKYQLGGSFESLFTIYKPVLTEPPRRTASGGSESKRRKDDDDDDTKGKLTEKDLFTMLKDLDGLPNEMKRLVSNLTRTLQIASITGSGDLNNIATTYLSSLLKLKQAKYNRDLFKLVYDKSVDKGNINEIAITTDGRVLAMDKENENKIVAFTPEEWTEVRGSGLYEQLTNSNLLWFRSHHPGYVDNNEILQIVENGVSLDLVHKMIKDRFHNLGKTDAETNTIVPKEAVKGHLILETMMQYGPEGYYKIKEELSTVDEALIQSTLAYIYSTLPTNAKTRLAVETLNGSLEEVQNVIQAMLFGTVSSSHKYDTSYLGTEEKLTSSGSKDGKDGSGNENIATKLINGYGGRETFGIQLGDEYLTIVSANTLPLVGKGDTQIGPRQPISKVMESSFGNVFDLRHASIGGSVISPYEINRIISEDGKIRTIDFPCTRNENGTIVPNLSPEIRGRKKQADAQLRLMGINPTNPDDISKHYQTINLVYAQNQLTPPYGPNGQINEDSWARFAVMAVATDGRGIPNADKSLVLEVYDDYEAEAIASAISESDKNYSYGAGYFGIGGDTIYKGTLWVPIFESYNMATATEKISSQTARRYDELDQARSNRSTLNNYQPGL